LRLAEQAAAPVGDRPMDTEAWLRCVRSSFAYWDSLMLDVGDFIRASGAGTAHVLA